MQKIFLGLILFISPFFLFAHNPLSAVYKLENISNGSVLKVNLTQGSINKTLKDIYDPDFLAKITQKEYKELVVRYVKENFNLKINDKQITLSKGGIRLGNHQTDLSFITSFISEEIKTIDLEITSFKNNQGHHNMFFYKRNGESEKIVLSQKNDFKSEVDFQESTEPSSFFLSKTMIIIVISLIGTALLVFFGLKFKKVS